MTKKEVAAHFGRTVAAVSHWVRLGCPYNKDAKSFSLDEVTRWRESRRGSIRPGRKPREKTPTEKRRASEKEKWDIEYRKLRTEKERLTIAQVRGDLVPKADVDQGRSERVRAVKTALFALTSRLPPILEGKRAGEIRRILDAELRLIVRNFAGEN